MRSPSVSSEGPSSPWISSCRTFSSPSRSRTNCSSRTRFSLFCSLSSRWSCSRRAAFLTVFWIYQEKTFSLNGLNIAVDFSWILDTKTNCGASSYEDNQFNFPCTHFLTQCQKALLQLPRKLEVMDYFLVLRQSFLIWFSERTDVRNSERQVRNNKNVQCLLTSWSWLRRSPLLLLAW